MRIIGHLPNESSAATFSDFLYVQGITNQVEAEKDGWAIWIHSEDQLERARDFLSNYLGNPRDPRYEKDSQRAAEQRQREQAEAAAVQKRVYGRDRLFQSWLPGRYGPLTILLILACVGVAVWSRLGGNLPSLEPLLISQHRRELTEVAHGEVWRLITPIFIHFGFLHLFFNMLWLLDLGSMIEGRKGTLQLALLVVGTAALSNLAQFYYRGPLFGGMSGVVYGLLGYAWMKGKFDPGSGIFLHSQTVSMMLIWLVLCMSGVLGPVANGAHVAGLVVGVAWGFLASLPVFRKHS